ncbi:MAG: hypothetical protein SH859_13340 [Hyphomicrobium aestuarii]|mgnify:CR=1 FL=1|nr:hypothetical protein [Hyphomicrobium aestuarii]
MSKLDQIRGSIEQLAPREISELREWLAELEARMFDERLARDLNTDGPAKRAIDTLADAALAEHRRGESHEL